jgi:hypothetical protein
MSIEIRPATAADADAIGQMGREFEEYLRQLGDAKVVSLTAERYLREGFGENPAFSGFIAEQAGNPVGYLLYTPSFDLDRAGRFLYIVELFVIALLAVVERVERLWTPRRLSLGSAATAR